ncbi:MAG TPA: DUF2279 domain-containing protein, partial [Aquaticitalea sp.]|nr:DUF2279 domain-containing protein [Aquaticitalea sp.]
MKHSTAHIIIALCLSYSVFAQSGLETFLKPSDTLNVKRRQSVYISEVAVGAAALYGLDRLWYSDYPRSKFHTLDDTGEWLQMDKLGHVFSAYQLGKIGADALKWSGENKNGQLLYGAGIGFVFLGAVEVLDGFSREWGFSWGDMVANTMGTGLYVGQQLLWGDQRIKLKFSFHRTDFAPLRPEKLGDGYLEELLKDYNGQTYWLSANVHSFFKDSKVPKWLNVAIGYGADGMISGKNMDVDGVVTDLNRRRQFYLSLDADLSKIRTDSHLLKALFDIINVIKIPFPTFEI